MNYKYKDMPGKAKDNTYTLTLSSDVMKAYGYKIIDVIVEHFETQNQKPPSISVTRTEMDALLNEDIPQQPSNPFEVLQFVVDNVLSNSSILSHPKTYSFVPGPSNYIGVMGDALATGFNVIKSSIL